MGKEKIARNECDSLRYCCTLIFISCKQYAIVNITTPVYINGEGHDKRVGLSYSLFSLSIYNKLATRMSIGKIGEFTEGKETFDNYVERVEQVFVANEIDDGKQVVVFPVGGGLFCVR